MLYVIDDSAIANGDSVTKYCPLPMSPKDPFSTPFPSMIFNDS
jgi:hypothetical protein